MTSRTETSSPLRCAPDEEVNEFRRDHAWRVVLAAWVGVAMGLTALPFYTLGIFAKPLALEFGWSRAVIQSGFSFSMLGVICSAWAAGWAIDRFGVRRVALFSQVGLALGFVGLAAQTGSSTLWQVSWLLLAVLGVGTTPLTWSRGIAAWFDQRRGLALGVALSGTGVTALVAPPLVNLIVSAHGWRAGYMAVALAIVLVAVPAVWLMFRDKPRAAPTAQAQAGDGLRLAQALRSRHFWLLIVGFWLICAAVSGLIPNLVPMLTDSGLTMTQAAGYASLLGLNVMAGRLLAGWLLDRFWGPGVALVLLMPPAVACLLLAVPQWPGAAVMMIGLAAGAEFDLIAYLCLRYFGTRNFGQIYAWQWVNFSVAAGAGPIAFAMIFDHSGSYHHALLAAAALLVLGPLLLLGLGRYPKAWPAG
ncbi:MFS transporter [Aquabacterium sp. OR-4]|uniref:MFS transporter n=1 Tax=Aquabacterium sp. OR-4 TaxID=2978127 RepID=UPI0021B2EE0D|nr:MFS transporter [Aquabacterium sp. OR-4]MDT7836978.1 MFS transporter [Aquabacterium sp. OR-4]